MMLRVLFAISCSILAFVPVLSAGQESPQGEHIQRGEFLFKGACGAYCHSVTAELRDAPYLFDCQWLHGDSDEAIFTVIFGGVSGTRMPAFGDNLPNGEDDIWRIIDFLKANRQSC